MVDFNLHPLQSRLKMLQFTRKSVNRTIRPSIKLDWWNKEMYLPTVFVSVWPSRKLNKFVWHVYHLCIYEHLKLYNINKIQIQWRLKMKKTISSHYWIYPVKGVIMYHLLRNKWISPGRWVVLDLSPEMHKDAWLHVSGWTMMAAQKSYWSTSNHTVPHCNLHIQVAANESRLSLRDHFLFPWHLIWIVPPSRLPTVVIGWCLTHYILYTALASIYSLYMNPYIVPFHFILSPPYFHSFHLILSPSTIHYRSAFNFLPPSSLLSRPIHFCPFY